MCEELVTSVLNKWLGHVTETTIIDYALLNNFETFRGPIFSKFENINKMNPNDRFKTLFANQNIINIFNKMDWNNVILAGGSILSCLLHYEINDYDFWIFGNKNIVTAKMKYINSLFGKYFTITKYEVLPSYIQISFSDAPSVQLLYASEHFNNEEILKLMNRFDLDPCRCWFDGFTIKGVPSQLNSIKTGEIINPIDYGNIKSERLIKYTNKGFFITRKHAKWLGVITDRCHLHVLETDDSMTKLFSKNGICDNDLWHGCCHKYQWFKPYLLSKQDLKKLESHRMSNFNYHEQFKIATLPVKKFNKALTLFPFMVIDENNNYLNSYNNLEGLQEADEFRKKYDINFLPFPEHMEYIKNKENNELSDNDKDDYTPKNKKNSKTSDSYKNDSEPKNVSNGKTKKQKKKPTIIISSSEDESANKKSHKKSENMD
jgi:hypothetical protein